MQIDANAKINLFLEVMNRRSDGYHEIRSVLTPVTLADRLLIEPMNDALELVAPEIVRLDGMPAPLPIGAPEDNLVFKAAKLLRDATGCRRGARIHLEKHVPPAGGLGGGSADAAAALTGLNRFWETGLSRVELMALAAQLGCDIPALVHGGAVCMTGRGELVRPVKWRAGWRPWLLLVNPGFGVSTGDIYKRYKPDLTSMPGTATFDNLLAALEGGCDAGLADGLFNALQHAVFDKYPLLELIAGQLKRLGAPGVLLSGTGATIFALAHDEEHGRNMAAELRQTMECRLWTSLACVAGDLEPA